MQFIKLDLDILKNNDLTCTDKLIYSILCDRMDSSRKRQSFYDKERNDYYVIYTIDEMKDLLGISKTTVVNSYKRLSNLGYLTKVKLFSSATRLFLPKYSILENDTPEFQKVESNHTNTKHTNKHKTHKTPNNDYFDVIAKSLIEKGGLSEHAVNMLKVYSFNDPKLLYNYASMIFKAKKRVSNEHKDVKDIISGTTLETNSELNYRLPKAIKQIIVTANHKAKNKNGYIYSALHNFFEECVDSYLQSKRKKTSNPIIESLV